MLRKLPFHTRLTGALLALCIATIGGYEGLRTKAYKDVVGVPTVCFGETRGVHMGDTYTVDQCKAMLGDALVDFEQGMRKCLVNPDRIPNPTYGAILSLSYNIGQKAFCGSTVRKRLNDGNIKGACDAFLMWNKAGGRVIAGLDSRRKEERKLCLQGA